MASIKEFQGQKKVPLTTRKGGNHEETSESLTCRGLKVGAAKPCETSPQLNIYLKVQEENPNRETRTQKDTAFKQLAKKSQPKKSGSAREKAPRGRKQPKKSAWGGQSEKHGRRTEGHGKKNRMKKPAAKRNTNI